MVTFPIGFNNVGFFCFFPPSDKKNGCWIINIWIIPLHSSLRNSNKCTEHFAQRSAGFIIFSEVPKLYPRLFIPNLAESLYDGYSIFLPIQKSEPNFLASSVCHCEGKPISDPLQLHYQGPAGPRKHQNLINPLFNGNTFVSFPQSCGRSLPLLAEKAVHS